MISMEEDEVFIKKGDERSITKKPGKLYRLMVKSHKMEASSLNLIRIPNQNGFNMKEKNCILS
jgi:hypothetical protein